MRSIRSRDRIQRNVGCARRRSLFGPLDRSAFRQFIRDRIIIIERLNKSFGRALRRRSGEGKGTETQDAASSFTILLLDRSFSPFSSAWPRPGRKTRNALITMYATERHLHIFAIVLHLHSIQSLIE